MYLVIDTLLFFKIKLYTKALHLLLFNNFLTVILSEVVKLSLLINISFQIFGIAFLMANYLNHGTGTRNFCSISLDVKNLLLILEKISLILNIPPFTQSSIGCTIVPSTLMLELLSQGLLGLCCSM